MPGIGPTLKGLVLYTLAMQGSAAVRQSGSSGDTSVNQLPIVPPANSRGNAPALPRRLAYALDLYKNARELDELIAPENHSGESSQASTGARNTLAGSEQSELLPRAPGNIKNPNALSNSLQRSFKSAALPTDSKPPSRLSRQLANEINCLKSAPAEWTDQTITATVSSAYGLIETISPLMQPALSSPDTKITSDLYEAIVNKALYSAGIPLTANEIGRQLNAIYLSDRFAALVEADPEREMIVLNALEFFRPHSIPFANLARELNQPTPEAALRREVLLQFLSDLFNIDALPSGRTLLEKPETDVKNKKSSKIDDEEKGKNTAGTQWVIAAARYLCGAINIIQGLRTVFGTESAASAAAFALKAASIANDDADEKTQQLQHQVRALVAMAGSFASQWSKERDLSQNAATEMTADAKNLSEALQAACDGLESRTAAVENARLHIDAYTSAQRTAAGRWGAAAVSRSAINAANDHPGTAGLKTQLLDEKGLAAATQYQKKTALPPPKELAALALKTVTHVVDAQETANDKIAGVLRLATEMQAGVQALSTFRNLPTATTSVQNLVNLVKSSAENAAAARSEALDQARTAKMCLEEDPPGHFTTGLPGFVLAIGSVVVRIVRQANAEGLSMDGTSRALLALSTAADLMHMAEFAFNPNHPAGRFLKETIDSFESKRIARPGAEPGSTAPGPLADDPVRISAIRRTAYVLSQFGGVGNLIYGGVNAAQAHSLLGQGRHLNAALMGFVSGTDLANGISQLAKNLNIDPTVDSKWAKLKTLATFYHSPMAYLSRGVASACAATTAGLMYANKRY